MNQPSRRPLRGLRSRVIENPGMGDRIQRNTQRVLKAPKATTLDEAVWDRWLDVQTAMASLSPLERTALVLTAVEGIPYADAAAMLGTSAGALRAAVSRARDKLEVA